MANIGTGESPRPRLDWLDGVRAYAIGAVVIVHSSHAVPALNGVFLEIGQFGQYGVQLFFCISAATVMLTYEASRSSGAPKWHWLVRRFLRIAPLYYAAIVFYYLWSVLKARMGVSQYVPSLLDIIANITFVHGFVPSANNSVVPGGWSIGVEMVFYAMVPIMYSCDGARRLINITALSVFLFIFATFFNGGFGSSQYWYFSPFSQLPVLLLSTVAFLRASPWVMFDVAAPRAWVVASAIAFPLGLVATAWLGTWGQVGPLAAPLPMAAAGVSFMVLVRGPLGALVRNKVARFIATRSFSIYIVHFAVLDVLKFVNMRWHYTDLLPAPLALLGVAALTLILAALASEITLRFIEAPGNSLARRLTARSAR